jgi:hypothetical protein
MNNKNYGEIFWRATVWVLRLVGLIFALSQIFVFAISPVYLLKSWVNLLMGVGMMLWIITSIKKQYGKNKSNENSEHNSDAA